MTGHPAAWSPCPVCRDLPPGPCDLCHGAAGWASERVVAHRLDRQMLTVWPLPDLLAEALEWHWHEHTGRPSHLRTRWEDLDDRAKADLAAEFIRFGCPTCAPTSHHIRVAKLRELAACQPSHRLPTPLTLFDPTDIERPTP